MKLILLNIVLFFVIFDYCSGAVEKSKVLVATPIEHIKLDCTMAKCKDATPAECRERNLKFLLKDRSVVRCCDSCVDECPGVNCAATLCPFVKPEDCEKKGLHFFQGDGQCNCCSACLDRIIPVEPVLNCLWCPTPPTPEECESKGQIYQPADNVKYCCPECLPVATLVEHVKLNCKKAKCRNAKPKECLKQNLKFLPKDISVLRCCDTCIEDEPVKLDCTMAKCKDATPAECRERNLKFLLKDRSVVRCCDSCVDECPGANCAATSCRYATPEDCEKIGLHFFQGDGQCNCCSTCLDRIIPVEPILNCLWCPTPPTPEECASKGQIYQPADNVKYCCAECLPCH